MGPATSWGKNDTNSAKSNEVLTWLQIAAIDIDRIAEGLKRVEGDAGRQEHLEHERARLKTQTGQQPLDVLHEKVEVLEESKQSQVAADAESQEQFLPGGKPHDSQATGIIKNGGRGDENAEPGMDVAIKDVAGRQQQQILAGFAPHQPIGGQNDAQQHHVVETREGHNPNPSARSRTADKSERLGIRTPLFPSQPLQVNLISSTPGGRISEALKHQPPRGRMRRSDAGPFVRLLNWEDKDETNFMEVEL